MRKHTFLSIYCIIIIYVHTNIFNIADVYSEAKESDQNIIDTINKARNKKAKEFMQNNHINISTIAEKVGFSYSNSFIRTFKKYEGITPGKYKERKGLLH